MGRGHSCQGSAPDLLGSLPDPQGGRGRRVVEATRTRMTHLGPYRCQQDSSLPSSCLPWRPPILIALMSVLTMHLGSQSLECDPLCVNGFCRYFLDLRCLSETALRPNLGLSKSCPLKSCWAEITLRSNFLNSALPLESRVPTSREVLWT